jgi:hypothetical protein
LHCRIDDTEPVNQRRRSWWLWTSLAAALTSVALPLLTRVVVGPPAAVVNVRWQADIDEGERSQLERQFRLDDGERLEGTTWRYALVDRSTDNVRALVTNPAVADTSDVDRSRYEVEPTATASSRRMRFSRGGDAAVGVADALMALLVGVAVFLAIAGVSGIADSPRALGMAFKLSGARAREGGRAVMEPVARWLTRGIPEIDRTTAGLFRIVFGTAVVLFMVSRPVNATRLETMFDPQIDGELHEMVLGWLMAHPAVSNAITPWLVVTGAAFTVGLLTRISFALFVAGAVLWGFGAVAFDSTHPHSTLLLTLIALLPSRWGDALSVDARIRPGANLDDTPARRYGYSVWVPSLVFGVAFAAAAWAKLAAHGIGWILNGTVKYHFITDLSNAAVDWGLQLASHPWLAISASFAAIVIEALVLVAAFLPQEAYRLAAGISAMALLAGFRIFMGVFWPGWWILLLGFLPWKWMAAQRAGFAHPTWAGGAHRLTVTPVQVTAIALVLAQQIVITLLGIERAPMFSNYPMYSSTFTSEAAFNAAMPPYYRIVVATDQGRVDLSCNASEDMVDALQMAVAGSADAARTIWRAVHGCRPDLTSARAVWVEQDRRVFDWTRLEYTTTRAVATVGPLEASDR